MEKLYYNLSEEVFSLSRRVLLLIFAGLFFLAGLYILVSNLYLGKISMNLSLSIAPFSICLIVLIILYLGSVRGKEQYFSIDNDGMEFQYGVFRSKRHTILWRDVKELVLPSRQKKALFRFNDGKEFILNLNWLQRRKTSLIRKQIYYAAKEKNLKIGRVNFLNGTK